MNIGRQTVPFSFLQTMFWHGNGSKQNMIPLSFSGCFACLFACSLINIVRWDKKSFRKKYTNHINENYWMSIYFRVTCSELVTAHQEVLDNPSHLCCSPAGCPVVLGEAFNSTLNIFFRPSFILCHIVCCNTPSGMNLFCLESVVNIPEKRLWLAKSKSFKDSSRSPAEVLQLMSPY